MFELRSAIAFAALPESSPLWHRLQALRAEHVALLKEVEERIGPLLDQGTRVRIV